MKRTNMGPIDRSQVGKALAAAGGIPEGVLSPHADV